MLAAGSIAIWLVDGHMRAIHIRLILSYIIFRFY